jgi:uncharacterized membrane protein
MFKAVFPCVPAVLALILAVARLSAARARTVGRRHLRRGAIRMYQWLLLGHLLGVVMFVAGCGAYTAAVDRLPRAHSVAELRTLLTVAAAGSKVLTVGTVPLLVGGAALTADAWSFTDGWIVIAMALVVVQGAGGLFVDRRVGRLDNALEEAADGAVPPRLRALAGDRLMHAVDRAAMASLAELVFLMVVKPGVMGIAVSLAIATVAGAALAWTVAAPGAARGKPEPALPRANPSVPPADGR